MVRFRIFVVGYDNEFVWGWSRDRENDSNTGDTKILDWFGPLEG
jgi:hypothetical protein